MSETRPHLEVVDEEAQAAGATPPARGGRSEDRKLWIVGAVLVAGLLICAGGWLAQAQEGARLERSLATSEAALASTRADLSRAEGRLAAFQSHLAGAQERLGSIRAEIAALADFLSGDPGEPAAAAAKPRP